MCLAPRDAAAQQTPLRIATAAAGAAAAADWVSTYHALKYFRVREVNPVLQPFQQSPGTLVSIGALMDVAGISTWNVVIGRAHPRVATTGLLGLAAFRTYLAIHNIRNERIAARRVATTVTKTD